MKQQELRLAETISMYGELRRLGIEPKEVPKFSKDCQVFVKDGIPSTGKCKIESLNKYLHYELKTKLNTESFAVIKNDRL